MQLDVNVDCGCEEVDIIDVECQGLPSLSTTCESDPKVAEKRAHCGAPGQAVAARSRKRKAHLRLLGRCNAEGAGCAERQR